MILPDHSWSALKLSLPLSIQYLLVLSLNGWINHHRSQIHWKKILVSGAVPALGKMGHWLVPLSDKGKCSFSKRQNWWPFLVDYKSEKAEGKIQQLDRAKLSLLRSPWTASGTKCLVSVCIDTLSEVHWPPLWPYSPHNHKNIIMVLTHLLLQTQF